MPPKRAASVLASRQDQVPAKRRKVGGAPAHEDGQTVAVQSRQELRAWLRENQARDTGAWLVTPKKSGDHDALPWGAVVDELLCFGWIDSTQRKSQQEGTKMQWISPRRKGSVWSRINKEKVVKLQAMALMEPRGTAAVERAQRDGTWEALDGTASGEAPPELLAALRAVANAEANWLAFPQGVRAAILGQLLVAKREETRIRKCEEIARLAGQNLRFGFVKKQKQPP